MEVTEGQTPRNSVFLWTIVSYEILLRAIIMEINGCVSLGVEIDLFSHGVP